MKKILSMLLSVVMLFSLIPMTQAEEEQTRVNPRQEGALKFILDMELLSGDVPEINSPATRSMLAEVAVRCMGFPAQSAAETSFSDVKSDEARSGYILAAYQNNLMLGYSDGRFIPNGSVDADQLIKVLCRMTGYSAIAEAEGGSAAAYRSAANKAGFLKRVSASDSRAVTIGELACAVKAAIKSDLVEMTGLASDMSEYKIIKGKNLLSEKLDVYTVSGQITANYFTGLAGASRLSEGQIELNRREYHSELNDIDSYLGREVILYLSNEDDNIVAVEKVYQAEDTELLLDSEDVFEITGDKISYAAPDGRSVSVSYASNGYLIQNGLAKLSWSKADLQAVDNGQIMLVDSNADGVFDIIFATQYTDLLVDRISLTNETVYFTTGSVPEKLDMSSGGKLKIDLTGQNGEKIDIRDIESGNVLSVALSADNSVCIAKLCTASVTGVCTQIDNCEALIDEVSYPLNAALKADNGWIELNKKGVFQLNFMGGIVSVDYTSAQIYTYGYLIGVNTPKGLNNALTFKILTDKGAVEYLKLAERVRVNNERAQTHDKVRLNQTLFPNGALKEQMIIYDLNINGEISSLQTAADGSVMDKNERTKVFSLDAHYDGGSTDYRTRYVGGANWKLFASKWVLDDACKVFILPAEKSSGDSDYGVYGVNSLVADTFYEDVQIFDADEKNVTPVIAVRGVQSHYSGTSLGVVTNVAQALDGEGNTVSKLSVFAGGAETKLLPKNEEIKVYTQFAITHEGDSACVEKITVDNASYIKNKNSVALDAIEPGDIIRYGTDSTGAVTVMEVLFRNRLPYLSENERYSYINEGWPHARLSTAAPSQYYYYGTNYGGFAQVLDVLGDGVLGKTKWKTYNYAAQTFALQGDAERLYRLGGASILQYDVGRKRVAAISIAEIEKDDLIYVYATTAGPTLAVVYK